MTHHRLITRRIALADMGKAGLAFMVLGTAACSSSSSEGGASTTAASAPDTTDAGPGSTTAGPGSTTAGPTTTEAAVGSEFHRIELGFVSAYVLYRGGEALLVDTGNAGDMDAIETGLGEIGLDWGAVGHVIVTHKHPDHIGSLGAVVTAAPDAAVYAGRNDIPAMMEVAEPMPVGDGDTVFDFDIIETPGHTVGHISALDSAGGILVVGDAINNLDGQMSGSFPEFTENITLANSSVKTLAQFEYEIAVFGHGVPILSGASDEVKKFASGVP